MKITIGIPCYDGVSSETLEDYMRFAYNLGRRTRHECFIAIKSKSEQFRARNAIVEAALQVGSDYLLMLDDDMVIEPDAVQHVSNQYGFIDDLLNHFGSIEKLGIIGVLYYQRGGECRPVLMKQGKDGGFYWLRDDEIKHALQEVDVQGGGCLLMDMAIFDKIESPWFEPELDLGTDVQICKKAKDAGFKVYSDTSIEFGHVRSSREVITSKNRHLSYAETCRKQGIEANWSSDSTMNLYNMDVCKYLGKSWAEIIKTAATYNDKNFPRFDEYDDKDQYYRSLGKEQLCRQAWFHNTPEMIQQMQAILSMIDTNAPGRGLDYGCGSAPVGFELALRGHEMTFYDLHGTPAYEFLKHRLSKYSQVNADLVLNGSYDYALFLDSIEHLEDWDMHLSLACGLIKGDGAIITNFFLNQDYDNTEHINMDKEGVKQFLIGRSFYPINDVVWLKRELKVA